MDRPIPIITLALYLLLGFTACSSDHGGSQTTAAVDGAGPSTAERAAAAPDRPPSGAPVAASGDTDQVREIEWDALIPDDFQPEKLLAEFPAEGLSDDDPRAGRYLEKLKALWDEAPVRGELDGATIRLPGFVVPVEADADETTGFLLVPYYGACIHVPPPPANQTVYVIAEAGKGTRPGLFDVVWVTGTLSVKRIANDVAEAGYTLYASAIEPYE